MDVTNDPALLLGAREPDHRNIIEEFKGQSVEEIRANLEQRRHSFATMILNIDYDLNISTIIRSHNAFCGQDIFYLGRRRFNRKGCVGTYKYENLTYLETLEEALKRVSADYTWVGIDNRPGATPMVDYQWPDNPMLVFGHEAGGLDFLPELPARCQDIVYIPQTGSVRSLNVGCAASIAMYDLSAKKGWL